MKINNYKDGPRCGVKYKYGNLVVRFLMSYE